MSERPRSPLAVRVIRSLVLRTQHTPLRPVWGLAYRFALKAVAAYLSLGRRDTSTYVRGSIASGDAVYGVSDIDLVVVVPGDPARITAERDGASRRFKRLGSLLGIVPRLVRVNVFEDAELDDLIRRPILTCGIDGPLSTRPGPPALFFGQHVLNDHYAPRVRPGLHGPMSDWRLISGRERRSDHGTPTADEQATYAWLELQCWWRHAFLAAANPDGVSVPLLCSKLVAEGARIWLWLGREERAESRRQAIDRALEFLPDEEATFRAVAEAERTSYLDRGPTLTEALGTLLRLSARIADIVDSTLTREGTTPVRVLPVEPGELITGGRRTGVARLERRGHVIPLADWRACVCPERIDEALSIGDGDPARPTVLAAAARDEAGGYLAPALRRERLLVLPTANPAATPLTRAALRAVQCASTDPVSFALADGREIADFPLARGWAVRDRARRAVAEHRAWLTDRASGSSAPDDLGRLFTAARAALLLESIELGDPSLAPAAASVTRALAERSHSDRVAAEDAFAAHRNWRLLRREPSASTVAAFRRVVRRLPAYASDH